MHYVKFLIPFFHQFIVTESFQKLAQPPLIYIVAANGHLEIVQLLMAMTNNPNVASNNGWTPMHSAACDGYLEIVQILMTSTSNPNVADNFGKSPIHSVLFSNMMATIDFKKFLNHNFLHLMDVILSYLNFRS